MNNKTNLMIDFDVHFVQLMFETKRVWNQTFIQTL